MKLKRILIILLTAVAMSSCAEEQVDKQQLLKNFNKAVEANSVEQMKVLILEKEGVEEKHVDALANIYIDLLGNNLKNALENNAEKNKLVNTKKVNTIMMSTFAFQMANPSTIIPESESYTEGGKEYVKITERKNTFTLLLKSEGGTTKFWPEDIKVENGDDLVNLASFLKDYQDILNNTPESEYPEAYNKLADKYVQPTSLEYKDQPVKAYVEGEEEVVKFVLTEKTNSFGKDVLAIRFLVDGTKDKCGKFSPKVFSIDLPLNGDGTYDFGKEGINGSLMKTNLTKSIMNGKITLEKVDENTYKGKIAAEKDDKNKIYGDFTAEICKE